MVLLHALKAAPSLRTYPYQLHMTPAQGLESKFYRPLLFGIFEYCLEKVAALGFPLLQMRF